MSKFTAIKSAFNQVPATPKKALVAVAVAAAAAIAFKTVQPTLAEKYPLETEESHDI